MGENKRFDEIKKIISTIYEDYKISSFPINLIELASNMGFIVKKLSYCSNDLKMINFLKELDGFNFYSSEYDTYIIVINDMYSSITRQNFTIAHELGHIILRHERNNEIEANFFASYLMVPSCLCYFSKICKNMFNIEFLSNYFEISYTQAKSVSKRLAKRYLYNKEIYNYEEIILNQVLILK